LGTTREQRPRKRSEEKANKKKRLRRKKVAWNTSGIAAKSQKNRGERVSAVGRSEGPKVFGQPLHAGV